MQNTLIALALLPALACASARPGHAPAEPGQRAVIQDDYDTARTLARETDRALLVSFSSRACVNCRKMEVQVFAEPGVSQALDTVVEARLYMDEPGDPYADLQQQWTGTRAVPAYVLVDPATGEPTAAHVGTADSAAFARFLTGDARR
jgi:thiol:disulfide interchange protein DsbD